MNETNGKTAKFDLHHDAWGKLVLIDEQGVRHAPVEPVRSFPITDPDHWVSICDAEGKELMRVEDLMALGPEVRRVLEQDLARREFVPIIHRVLSVPADTEPMEWEVETDRGPTRFLIHSGDDVRRLGPYRALLIDTEGIRYLVEDSRELDPLSRRVLEQYL